MTAAPSFVAPDGLVGHTAPNAIAVIGMGCKFPGADSVDEYWQLLDSGQSMVTEPPSGRFPTRDHKRSTEKSVFFGNFLKDIASFDNRFFKKSSREAASMDPQQRLLLEVAYRKHHPSEDSLNRLIREFVIHFSLKATSDSV